MDPKRQGFEYETLESPEELERAVQEETEHLQARYGLPVLGVIPRGPGRKSWFRRRKHIIAGAEKTEAEGMDDGR